MVAVSINGGGVETVWTLEHSAVDAFNENSPDLRAVLQLHGAVVIVNHFTIYVTLNLL